MESRSKYYQELEKKDPHKAHLEVVSEILFIQTKLRKLEPKNILLNMVDINGTSVHYKPEFLSLGGSLEKYERIGFYLDLLVKRCNELDNLEKEVK